MTRLLVAVVLLASPVAAQPPAGEDARLRGQSDQTYKRLVEARQKLTSDRPAEAVSELQRILDEAGDDLVGPSAGSHFRPAREIVQHFLATLPPDQLRSYRDRADAPARKLLDQGRGRRDPLPLLALIDRYFASRPAEEALLLLGELAFERGRFRAAEAYWSRLLPPADPAADPPFPDPQGEPAAVRARVILAMIFQGDLSRARAALAKFRDETPKAAGRLAGRDGPYADTLQALLDRPPAVMTDPPGDGEWTAFGGSAARSGRVSGRLPTHWPARPTWRTAIPRDRPHDRTALPRIASHRAVGFHPVVLDGVAYLADPFRVFGFDLLSGRQRFDYDIRSDLANVFGGSNVALPLTVDADFTLTAGGGRLYARLGVSSMTPPPPDAFGQAPQPTSFLVGFAPPVHPKPDGPPLEARWRLPPPSGDTAAAWEGAPVWSGGRLYAAFVRFDNNRLIHAVACYDDPPGDPVWVTDVADSPPAPGEPRHRHEPLALAGDSVVFCTHTGLAFALDLRGGRPAWAFRYPRATRLPGVRSPRDLCPPLVHAGRVFLAPADSDRVFALDAASGHQQWESTPFPVDQLLGVTRGRLVCTVAGPNRGVRGLAVTNGSDRDPDGWAVHDDPQLGSFGRGLVSDEAILWPTKARLFMLGPDDGMPLPRPQLYGPHGNLAYAEGVLLVATPTELWGYVSPRRELDARAAEAADRPGDAEAARRLAVSLADAGQWDRAGRAIDHAEPAAEPARVRAEWLSDRAERALREGESDRARDLLRQVTGEKYPLSWRARAVGRLLSIEPGGGGSTAADQFRRELGITLELEAERVFRTGAAPIDLGHLIAAHFRAPGPATRTVATTSRANGSAPGRPHQLDEAVVVSREVRFPSPRFVPLLPFKGQPALPGLGPRKDGEPRLLATDGRRVLAFRPAQVAPVWSASLPAGLAVTHGAESGDTVIAAGPTGAVALDLPSGRTEWSFRLPDADPFGSSPVPVPRSEGTRPPPPGLSDFALAGRQFVARFGTNHLLALDVPTGRVAWLLNAGGGTDYVPYPVDPGPRFSPPFLADEFAIVVQVSTGERWVVSHRGEVVHTARSAAVAWDHAPVRLDRDILAAPDGPGLVRAFELGSGRPGDRLLARTAWEHRVPGETSLTGRPPALRGIGDGLLVAVSRNHGVELDRLLAGTGNRAWDGPPVLLPVAAVDLTAAGTDGAVLYLPAEGRLFAVRLTDGRMLWATDLPPGESWRVGVGRSTVVAWPTVPAAADPLDRVADRTLSSFAAGPRPGRLPGLALGVYDAWVTRAAPVLVIDARTGRVRRRLDLPAGPVVAAHLDAGTAVVATAGRAYWLTHP